MLLLCLAWGAALAWLLTERRALRAHEGDKLLALVRALDGIVAQQLIAINTALRTVEAQQAGRHGAALSQVGPLLGTLSEAMPGVRALSVLDAEGVVRASSDAGLVGESAAELPYFTRSRAQPRADLLHIAPPFESRLGGHALVLSRALLDAQGRFAGVASATLDPGYFRLVLQTAQPSAETWSALVHEEGRLFALQPDDWRWIGRDLRALPGSILARHLDNAGMASLYLMPSLISGDLRQTAARSVLPDGLAIDRHLVVAVGRSLEALERPWRRQRAAVLMVGAGLSLAAVLSLALWQRRQRQVEALQQRQRRRERDAAARMALVLEGGELGLWDWDVPSGRCEFDARGSAMLGRRPEELPDIGSWRSLLHPEDETLVLTRLHACIEGRAAQYTAQFRLRHRDGHWVWLHSNGRVMVRDAAGRAQRMVGTHLDISALKNGQEQLEAQAQHTQAILDHMVDGVITIDAQGCIESVNPSACAMFGYAADEMLGRNVSMLMPEPDRSRHDGYITNYLQGGPARVIGLGRDVTGQRKDGSAFPMSLAVSRIEREGRTLFIGLTRDITERKRAEAAIERLAFYDPLTGLPNRRLLLDRLNQALAASRRSGRHGAVLFIDMDNFKALNDTLGHGMGDQLLQGVARRLQASLRAEDTVARWGGDEFVVLLQELGQQHDEAVLHAEAAAEKLLRMLGQPYALDGRTHHSTPSIGIVLWGERATDSEELLKHADHAMYQAKAGGRNRLCFFDPATQAAMAERAALEAELRRAIDLQHFELHCQPQVGRDGALLGGELLLRWRHAERGWVSPAQFIPLAEQTGLIVPLGEWVLQQSCALLARWAQDPALALLTLAVNLSAIQLRQKGFLGLMQQLLARSGAPTERLKIELTESALLEDSEAAIRLMGQLRGLGLKFSLDDFGTGYSSLAYLKRLPLTQLKIDQSFVRDLLDEPNARAIAHAIIQMGDSLGLEVIAEGVETQAQRELLAGQGCHAFQGWLFGRPLALDAFERLARAWTTGDKRTVGAVGTNPVIDCSYSSNA